MSVTIGHKGADGVIPDSPRIANNTHSLPEIPGVVNEVTMDKMQPRSVLTRMYCDRKESCDVSFVIHATARDFIGLIQRHGPTSFGTDDEKKIIAHNVSKFDTSDMDIALYTVGMELIKLCFVSNAHNNNEPFFNILQGHFTAIVPDNEPYMKLREFFYDVIFIGEVELAIHMMRFKQYSQEVSQIVKYRLAFGVPVFVFDAVIHAYVNTVVRVPARYITESYTFTTCKKTGYSIQVDNCVIGIDRTHKVLLVLMMMCDECMAPISCEIFQNWHHFVKTQPQ